MSNLSPLQWDFTLASRGLQTTQILHKPAKLLLVDDEPRLLQSLCDLLGNRGFILVTANSGTEAIERLSSDSFDLIILDLRMPDISGHEVMDYMNLHQIDANVIVTSGDVGIEAAIGALRRGAYDYLRKPYPREELIKAVQNALHQRQLEAENKQIAGRLESSERIYRYLVDSSPDIIFTLDHQGKLTFVNNRIHPLLGFNAEELIGKHYADMVHTRDLERANYVFSDGQQQQRWSRNIELRLKSRHLEEEGRVFSVELMSVSFTTQVMRTEGIPQNLEQMGIYGVARDITDRKRADELIAYQAYYDILTDLPNRVLFKDRLNLALLQAKRKKGGLAVMFVDLDRFKVINDSLGHQLGDELLQQATIRLKGCLRHSDTLSRFGSDEFNVVLPELDTVQDPTRVAQAFLDALRAPFALGGQTIHITASIGVAVYPKDGESVDELIRNADLAMHAKKSSGRNGYQFFELSMLNQSFEQISVESGLRLALLAGELEMYYQPQVDAKSGRVIGAEALMRWNHPQRGFLGAGAFLPYAEESGLIIAISDWMLEAVCRDLLAWNTLGDERPYLSINLSPHYLDRGDFFDKLKATLERFQVPPAQLEVEITENICIRNPQAAIDQLQKLCQLGVRVAIDDFGTGYSSLAYLHRFPIHVLKIDRSFVMPIEDDTLQFPVVLAIISIAKGLGLKLVAEGVETEVQQRYLEQAGCQTFQGYYYHRPMSQRDMMSLLDNQRIH
ncbi:EAL domain-containing protein [Rhodoferax sp. U11-2br]|uniref:EAL domain-containing response regulator n=1 Tax=Rhodoferax sp. U11-2br TaxID=2838878 RepID=UPI001BE96CC0|nr:EAL domain-containing protein [Rhodoferax sp. U11-2br]MBT3068934.1 EAL domain-containing protein [Rhodoferax sp. U11-2br]